MKLIGLKSEADVLVNLPGLNVVLRNYAHSEYDKEIQSTEKERPGHSRRTFQHLKLIQRELQRQFIGNITINQQHFFMIPRKHQTKPINSHHTSLLKTTLHRSRLPRIHT